MLHSPAHILHHLSEHESRNLEISITLPLPRREEVGSESVTPTELQIVTLVKTLVPTPSNWEEDWSCVLGR